KSNLDIRSLPPKWNVPDAPRSIMANIIRARSRPEIGEKKESVNPGMECPATTLSQIQSLIDWRQRGPLPKKLVRKIRAEFICCRTKASASTFVRAYTFNGEG